jgi:hypothetical protein
MLLTWIKKKIHNTLNTHNFFFILARISTNKIDYTYKNKHCTVCFLRTKFGQHKGTMCIKKKKSINYRNLPRYIFLHYKTIILPKLLKYTTETIFRTKIKIKMRQDETKFHVCFTRNLFADRHNTWKNKATRPSIARDSGTSRMPQKVTIPTHISKKQEGKKGQPGKKIIPPQSIR